VPGSVASGGALPPEAISFFLQDILSMTSADNRFSTARRVIESPVPGGNMKVSDAIRTKRAVRKFRDQPIPRDVILAILNAGRRSQSSKNEQQWHFIAIQEKATLKALSTFGTWAGHLAGAPLGVAILTPDPTHKFQTMFDAGQAAAYMQLMAWEMGIGSCLASIYEHEKAREILRFPADWHLRIALSFGYPLEKEKLTAAPKKGGRRSLEDIVHWDTW
jgi:nitroreductase